MKSKFSTFGWIATAAFVGCLAFIDSGIVSSASAEDAVAEGRELYNQFGCYQCHGHYGQGASTGPKLAPQPHPYNAFKVFVRKPVMSMPPYTEKVLSDDQLKEIHHYLESLEIGASVEAIPLLR